MFNLAVHEVSHGQYFMALHEVSHDQYFMALHEVSHDQYFMALHELSHDQYFMAFHESRPLQKISVSISCCHFNHETHSTSLFGSYFVYLIMWATYKRAVSSSHAV